MPVSQSLTPSSMDLFPNYSRWYEFGLVGMS